MPQEILIGVDEAGRGPLAGPVTVGVFAVKNKALLKVFKGVKDSKQLTPDKRGEWFRLIRQECLGGHAFYAVSFTRAEIIDEMGLTYAVRSAIDRSMKKVESWNQGCLEGRVLLDGLLKAPRRYKYQETIIDGDAKEPIIALASICAKVLRDRRMTRLSKLYPEYGFEKHKGYGTEEHYVAIRKYGPSAIHRRRFLVKMRNDINGIAVRSRKENTVV